MIMQQGPIFERKSPTPLHSNLPKPFRSLTLIKRNPMLCLRWYGCGLGPTCVHHSATDRILLLWGNSEPIAQTTLGLNRIVTESSRRVHKPKVAQGNFPRVPSLVERKAITQNKRSSKRQWIRNIRNHLIVALVVFSSGWGRR